MSYVERTDSKEGAKFRDWEYGIEIKGLLHLADF
jgi:hypothetical protein